MPRKSAAALQVVAQITDSRPPAPDDLTLEQQAEWSAIVNRLPVAAFPRECFAMLRAYVQHASAFRLLSKLIDEFQPDWLRDQEGLRATINC